MLVSKIITIGLVFLSFQVSALAGTSKSTACLVILETLKNQSTNQSERAYTMNTLSAVGSHIYPKMTEVTPNTAEGFFSSDQWLTEREAIQISGRLNGIKDFMTGQTNESKDRRFMFMSTIYGRTNIEKFFNSIHSTANEKTYWVHESFQTGSLISIYGLYITVPMALVNLITGHYELTSFLAGSSIYLADNLVTPSLNPNAKLVNDDYDLVVKGIRTPMKKNWRILSSDVLINKQTVTEVLRGNDEGHVNNYRLTQGGKILNWLSKNVFGFLKRYKGSDIWVGTDFLLTSSPDGVPELHVIIRGTFDAPPFPKTSKEKKKKFESNAPTPILESGLVPIPIKN